MTEPATAALCEHEWAPADLHVCPSIVRVDNQHAHYSWAVCVKCGEGGYGTE